MPSAWQSVPRRHPRYARVRRTRRSHRTRSLLVSAERPSVRVPHGPRGVPRDRQARGMQFSTNQPSPPFSVRDRTQHKSGAATDFHEIPRYGEVAHEQVHDEAIAWREPIIAVFPAGQVLELARIQPGDSIRESRREKSKTLVHFIDTTANRADQPAGQTTWSSPMASQAPHCGQRRIGVFIVLENAQCDTSRQALTALCPNSSQFHRLSYKSEPPNCLERAVSRRCRQSRNVNASV